MVHNKPSVSLKPYNKFMFCIACPEAPFIKLSIAEKIMSLFFNLVLQTEISQLLVLIIFPVPNSELIFKILMNLSFLYFFLRKL